MHALSFFIQEGLQIPSVFMSVAIESLVSFEVTDFCSKERIFVEVLCERAIYSCDAWPLSSLFQF